MIADDGDPGGKGATSAQYGTSAAIAALPRVGSPESVNTEGVTFHRHRDAAASRSHRAGRESSHQDAAPKANPTATSTPYCWPSATSSWTCCHGPWRTCLAGPVPGPIGEPGIRGCITEIWQRQARATADPYPVFRSLRSSPPSAGPRRPW